jgi:hypothetical protein
LAIVITVIGASDALGPSSDTPTEVQDFINEL